MQEKVLKISEDCSEYHYAVVFASYDDAESKLAELAKTFDEKALHVLSIELFGAEKFAESVRKFKKSLNAENVPTLHVLPLDEVAEPMLAGAHIIALSGTSPIFKQSPCGAKAAVYKAGDFEYGRIFELCLPSENSDLADYTYQTISELDKALQICGFEFSDIGRTWFYNHDILAWYDAFNKGRTKFFTERKVFDKLLPASTGIGGPNPLGNKISCGTIAIKDAAKNKKMFEVESPLQCGAPKYGSSFSRAVEMDFDTCKRVMVSGTASIDPVGNTVYFGDIDKQVGLTMQVIEEILKARGMGFKDVHRAIVYSMNPKFYEAFLRWTKTHGNFPHIPAYNTVCRHDLMFEVELDAGVNK